MGRTIPFICMLSFPLSGVVIDVQLYSRTSPSSIRISSWSSPSDLIQIIGKPPSNYCNNVPYVLKSGEYNDGTGYEHVYPLQHIYLLCASNTLLYCIPLLPLHDVPLSPANNDASACLYYLWYVVNISLFMTGVSSRYRDDAWIIINLINATIYSKSTHLYIFF